MFELTGRTALVTGATGTIGATIARSLHDQGATVAISGTRREVLDKLAAELGGRVHILPANLADATETEALVPRAAFLRWRRWRPGREGYARSWRRSYRSPRSRARFFR